MITRVSRKPQISFRFRKLPDQAEVSSWLSVYVQAKNKRFDQKGTFTIRNCSDVWDEQTILRLEELSVRSDTLRLALEESMRDQPTEPPKEEIKNLGRTGYRSIEEIADAKKRLTELTSPYLEWFKQFTGVKRAHDKVKAELVSLFAEMVHQRSELPEKLLAHAIPLKREEVDERTYVLYRSSVWCSEQELKPEQWPILVDHFLEREETELAAALTPLSAGESETTRERIPPEVRRAVWIRDQGKCARCGSRVRLEYDHIVPVSRGGSNTERNIELLCEFHNRAKSNNIS